MLSCEELVLVVCAESARGISFSRFRFCFRFVSLLFFIIIVRSYVPLVPRRFWGETFLSFSTCERDRKEATDKQRRGEKKRIKLLVSHHACGLVRELRVRTGSQPGETEEKPSFQLSVRVDTRSAGAVTVRHCRPFWFSVNKFGIETVKERRNRMRTVRLVATRGRGQI